MNNIFKMDLIFSLLYIYINTIRTVLLSIKLEL